MPEEWRPIIGYEGAYEVSSTGRVVNVRGSKRRLLTATPHYIWGHMRVTLSVNGFATIHNVHRLVARAFIGEPTGPLVRHIDGDPSHNEVSNLAYGTSAENNADTVQHGHHWAAKRDRCRNGHEYTAENTRYQPNGRCCRACDRAAAERYRRRQAESVSS